MTALGVVWPGSCASVWKQDDALSRHRYVVAGMSDVGAPVGREVFCCRQRESARIEAHGRADGQAVSADLPRNGREG